MSDNTPQNKQLFYTIEVLDEAINKERKVSFTYNSYGTDKKLHPRTRDDGSTREYIVSPYQIAATNGRYYLICNYDKYQNVANYRLDRITNIKILDDPSKPVRQIKGLENGIDLPRHMAEHIYMFSGESATVTFKLKRNILNDVIDWFGGDITFTEENEEEMTAKVTVNLAAMRRWALQYALHAKILTPASLAEQVKNDIECALGNYNS